ncbi:S-type pyocin domain-containing protein [Pseudomonas silesiensis]|uniref:S-type pyocin domain-containing protein n=1 Tax=Pseudomonas silesiensis TaxID=1853130 RepID=UPI0030DC7EFD
MVLTPEGVRIAQEVAAVLERAVAAGIDVLGDMGRIAVKTGPVFVTAMVYSPTLGDGELTPEQRNRLLQAIGVPAQALDLYDGPELQAIADAGGTVEVENRLKLVAVAQGTAIIVASTGGEIDSRVPVVNAVLDPLTGLYTAEIPGSPTRHLQFSPDAAPQASSTGQAGLAVPEPQVQDIPPGVDVRIQDCIVCVPGLAPLYLSFNVPPMGSGIVTGTGQTAATGWWNTASQAQGAAIPTQIGEQFRGREFKSFTAFDEALWQTVAEHQVLTPQLDEVNKKRLEQGFAPYAPKNTWVGDQREFELRYQERGEFWADPFNLDKISIKTPSSAEGWPGVLPTVVPWPIQPVAGTWTPLVPPGSEHLGSTTLPIAPILPGFFLATRPSRSYRKTRRFRLLTKGRLVREFLGFRGTWNCLRRIFYSLIGGTILVWQPG